MARHAQGSLVERLQRFVGRPPESSHDDIRRIEERRRSLAAATQEWLALLREMEHEGRSGDAKYEAFYQAYLQAKQQQKRTELELFNLRHGLTN